MDSKVKRLAILGSTGSIGRQTLEVVRAFPTRFQVVGLAAGRNLDLLAEQVSEFRPRFIASQDSRNTLGEALGAQCLPVEEIAIHPDVDMVVVATSGKAGLAPTLAAVAAGKRIALANKEVLVMAGEIIISKAREKGAEILPIDSEHSALWQCLCGEKAAREGISRLILTASGGAFRDRSLGELGAVTAEEALRHPTWQMGRKVTIDSATLMNKGMEVIEAHWLFGVPFDRIEVVLHRESIVHSLVEFVDGSVKAQLSLPDMRLPIQYALSYPERWPNAFSSWLDLTKVRSLSFEAIEEGRFPCLALARKAAGKGGTYPAVLCAADEVAVELFLAGRIGFLDIPSLVGRALEEHCGAAYLSLEHIIDADAWTREHMMAWGQR